MTGAAFAFRCRLHTVVVAKADVHDTTLVRRHRTKLDAAVLASCAVRGRTGNRFQLLALTALVTFDVHDDRVAR